MCDGDGHEGHGHHHDHHDHHAHDEACDQGGTRIAVVGKGGVGKTTLSALLARHLARQGWPVIAVDADEQCNLAVSLGVDPGEAAGVTAVAQNADYVEEKTGERPGTSGGMLRLNPDVTDIVDRLGTAAPDGVRLLVMGGVARAGAGCLCPETSLLAATVSSMRLHDHDIVIMDTHAGVEHFGRALARGFDQAVVVVDPTFNSVAVGVQTARLSRELGIGRIHLVINRVREDADVAFVLDELAAGGLTFHSIVTLPYDEQALGRDPSVTSLLAGSALLHAVDTLTDSLLDGSALGSPPWLQAIEPVV